MTRAFAQIQRVASEGSSEPDMWILETSEQSNGGYMPRQGMVYSATHKRVTIRMAPPLNINEFNVMVGSGLVRIDSITTPGGSGRMTVTFDRDEPSRTFDLYIYVLDSEGRYEPVYLLDAGDPKPSPQASGVNPAAVTYTPPPVIIGGGSPVARDKG